MTGTKLALVMNKPVVVWSVLLSSWSVASGRGAGGLARALLGRQHRARARRRPAAAGKQTLQRGRVAFVVDQCVVVVEFLARVDVAQRVDVHAAVLFVGFAIGFAGVVDPAGVVAAPAAVDHVAVGEAEVKRMIDRATLFGGTARRYVPRDAFPAVLDDPFARRDGAQREHAVAVHGRFPDLVRGGLACGLLRWGRTGGAVHGSAFGWMDTIYY